MPAPAPVVTEPPVPKFPPMLNVLAPVEVKLQVLLPKVRLPVRLIVPVLIVNLLALVSAPAFNAMLEASSLPAPTARISKELVEVALPTVTVVAVRMTPELMVRPVNVAPVPVNVRVVIVVVTSAATATPALMVTESVDPGAPVPPPVQLVHGEPPVVLQFLPVTEAVHANAWASLTPAKKRSREAERRIRGKNTAFE